MRCFVGYGCRNSDLRAPDSSLHTTGYLSTSYPFSEKGSCLLKILIWGPLTHPYIKLGILQHHAHFQEKNLLHWKFWSEGPWLTLTYNWASFYIIPIFKKGILSTENSDLRTPGSPLHTTGHPSTSYPFSKKDLVYWKFWSEDPWSGTKPYPQLGILQHLNHFQETDFVHWKFWSEGPWLTLTQYWASFNI